MTGSAIAGATALFTISRPRATGSVPEASNLHRYNTSAAIVTPRFRALLPPVKRARSLPRPRKRRAEPDCPASGGVPDRSRCQVPERQAAHAVTVRTRVQRWGRLETPSAGGTARAAVACAKRGGEPVILDHAGHEQDVPCGASPVRLPETRLRCLAANWEAE